MDSATLQVLIVIFFATLFRSAFGFGESLIAVPLLALFIPLKVATPLSVLVSITIAGVVVAQDWRKIHLRSAGWLVFCSLFGIPVGLLLLIDRHIAIEDRAVGDGQLVLLAGTEVDARTAICVLTHDPKFDVPLLEVALRTPAAYIGAMGSRRTHEDRLERLREAGLTEEELGRLRSPIGLDLGARTPEETAVSITAELIQLRWGGSGQPLTETDGRIHHPLAVG